MQTLRPPDTSASSSSSKSPNKLAFGRRLSLAVNPPISEVEHLYCDTDTKTLALL